MLDQTKLMRAPLKIEDYALFNSDQQRKQYWAKVKSLSPIAYWPMWEASGAVATDISGNGRNGAYTGVTLGQTGIGDGRTCPLFDGANDFNNIYSVSFRDAFNGGEGTVALWAKVSAGGVWTDGTVRYLIYLTVDANNFVYVRRSSVNGFADWIYKAGGTQETVQLGSLSTTDWFHMALTWSATSDEMIAYYNGSQTGSTQTGLGVWAGNLGALSTLIGAINQVPANVWSGYLAHCAVWDSALTDAQVSSLAAI